MYFGRVAGGEGVPSAAAGWQQDVLAAETRQREGAVTPGIVDADDSAEGRREATTTVLRFIVALLSPYAPSDKTAWLAERLRLLEDTATPSDVLATTMSELHRVLPGMGGLTDIYLDAGTPEATEQANAELLRLANQLYALTEA